VSPFYARPRRPSRSTRLCRILPSLSSEPPGNFRPRISLPGRAVLPAVFFPLSVSNFFSKVGIFSRSRHRPPLLPPRNCSRLSRLEIRRFFLLGLMSLLSSPPRPAVRFLRSLGVVQCSSGCLQFLVFQYMFLTCPFLLLGPSIFPPAAGQNVYFFFIQEITSAKKVERPLYVTPSFPFSSFNLNPCPPFSCRHFYFFPLL